MKEARLIIADGHQLVRQGLRNIFERASGFTVVAEAADGAEAELLQTIRFILDGGTRFPRPQHNAADRANPFAVLSAREEDVMRGLLCGEALADMAACLGIGAKSITTYRRRLLDKLGVNSNAELAALHARQNQP